jgi:V8-like Glu-specific endopeptidase
VRFLSRVSPSRICLAALAATVACLAAPGVAPAYVTEDPAGAVRDYWTPERMETAIPGDALLSDVAAVVPIGDVDLGLGSTQARRANAQKVSNPGSKPFRTHGKVFMTDGGLDYVCSGTSIKSKTEGLVVTAGHCTHSSNGYVTNFMFAPAYDDGPSKFGEWAAKKIKTTPQWEANENISYDVGMATMHKLNGKTLADKVGKRGIVFNKSDDQSFDVFGYPAEDPFEGEKMYRCDSQSEGRDNDQNNPKPIRIDCNMTGGSSGGGWVIGGENVNSVVSYGYECTIPIPPLCSNPEEGKLFGPYFGNEIKKLYKSQK